MRKKNKKKKNKIKIQKQSKRKLGGLSEEELFFLCKKVKLNDNFNGVISTVIKNNYAKY